MVNDIYNILVQCVGALGSREWKLVLLVGLGAAAVCWISANFYTRLWNKRYHLTLSHQILCFAAALVTFFSVVIYFSLKHLQEIAIQQVQNWEEDLLNDSAWQEAVYSDTYYQIKSLGLENFDGVPEPGQQGAHIPVTRDETKMEVSKIYSRSAIKTFNDAHPFLRKFMRANLDVPQQKIQDDMNEHFKTNPTYPPQKVVALSAEEIRGQLVQQTPRAVKFGRLIAVLLFFLIQAIPFGIIGYAAYKDIKVHV